MTTARRISILVLTSAVVVTLALAAPRVASAHRTGGYLQAARIGIEPRSVDVYLDLTPGSDVAEPVIRMMDRDGDGLVSRDEQEAYARAFVKDLEVDVDGDALGLHLVTSEFPTPAAFLEGTGTIHAHAFSNLPRLAPGAHTLSFGYRGTGEIDSAFLANALVPESARVEVLRQRRDEDQTELEIDYSLRTGPVEAALAPLALTLAATGLTVLFTRRWRHS